MESRNMLTSCLSALLLATITGAMPTIDGTWSYSEFGMCSGRCGPGHTKTRTVQCTDAAGNMIDESRCDASLKPNATVPCSQVDCPAFPNFGAYGVCRRCVQLREQTCSQVLANGSEVELPVVRCGLSDLTAQRTCKESLCKPRWVSRAYNCCDSRASQGLACTDMFSGDDIRDQACHDRVAELNLTVPTPAPCTPACPTTVQPTTSALPTTTTSNTPSAGVGTASPDRPGDVETVGGEPRGDELSVDNNRSSASRKGAPVVTLTLCCLLLAARFV